MFLINIVFKYVRCLFVLYRFTLNYIISIYTASYCKNCSKNAYYF